LLRTKELAKAKQWMESASLGKSPFACPLQISFLKAAELVVIGKQSRRRAALGLALTLAVMLAHTVVIVNVLNCTSSPF